MPDASSAAERLDRLLAALKLGGVALATTVQAFRLDAVDDDVIRGLRLGPRHAPRSSGGLLLPTFMPKAPERIVGLIRVRPSQGRHGFIGRPVGIAGPISVVSAPRVVLVDAPMLALRLYDRGIQNVAIVEHLDVLTTLVPWIAQRTVVLASHRYAGIEAMRNALPAHLRQQVESAMLRSCEGSSPDDDLKRIGATFGQLRFFHKRRWWELTPQEWNRRRSRNW